MLTKNINVQRNLVNGARGVVKGFDPAKGMQNMHVMFALWRF